MLYIQVHLGTAHDAVSHAQIRMTPETSDLHLNCTSHAQYVYTMDGRSGELGVSLHGHMQLIVLLGALRVVIAILRIYIKKANFQIQIQSPDSAVAHQRTRK